MKLEKSNIKILNIKNILLVNNSIEQMESELGFLKEINFTVQRASGRTAALKIMASNDKPVNIVLLDPHLGTLKEGIETAKSIISAYNVPILFYTDHTDEPTISATNEIDHYGFITISSGPQVLLSSLIRVSKAQDKYIEGQAQKNPIQQLVDRIVESNKILQKSDYGYLTTELVDAVIIDDPGGNIITANIKACQILGLTLDQIKNNYIYKSNWEFIHEDHSPFLMEEHPHLISRKSGDTLRNIIMGIKRPGEKTQWLSNSSLAIFDSDGETLTGVATYFYDITDLITAKEDNERWANIFHHAEWGIVLGEVGSNNLGIMNNAFARMYGYTLEELKGQPAWELFAPKFRDSVSYHQNKALKEGHHRFESLHLRKDGSTFPVMVDITCIKDKSGKPQYRAVNVIDITEIKNYEESLREAKEYSDALFNNSPIAIYSIDKNNEVVNFNKKAEEITGFSREELIGKKFNIFSEEIAVKSKVGKECRIKTKDEKDKIIESYSSYLYDSKGNITENIESFIDITTWKELQDFKEDIEKIIRHDLKTPLNSIIGFPKLMLTDESLSDEYREYLMIILLAGQNMLNLINASLNMYKLEEGTYDFNFQNVNIILIIQQIRNILKGNGKKRHCSINFLYNNKPLEKGTKIAVKTEKNLLNMILTNLIKNALEASPPEGVITVNIEDVEKFRISIHNMGSIPENIRTCFFEKNVTFGKKGGNGLGTYSAKLMANAINAELDFTTEEKEGTTLFLTL